MHSSDVQAAEGSDSLGRSKGEADKGGAGGGKGDRSPEKPVGSPGPLMGQFLGSGCQM